MRLLVIDGNSIANRAFYGIKLLTTKDGRYTNAIYGFLNILLSLLKECQPDEVAVAFDLKAPTFRHKMYDGYKATRHAMPEELAQQMPVLKQLLADLGYRTVTAEGWEADDILGTLAAACAARKDDCFLATGDRDSLQLVSESTTVLLAATVMGRSKTVVMDEDAIQEKYGLAPKQLIEVKSLMGDTSDNIPGVKGIGEKTALSLVQTFGSLEGVYQNIDDKRIKPKQREHLLEDKPMAELSHTLGTIRTDAPIDTAEGSYTVGEGNKPAAVRLLQELEIHSLIPRFGLDGVAPEAAAEEQAIELPEADIAPLPLTPAGHYLVAARPAVTGKQGTRNVVLQPESWYAVQDTTVYPLEDTDLLRLLDNADVTLDAVQFRAPVRQGHGCRRLGEQHRLGRQAGRLSAGRLRLQVSDQRADPRLQGRCRLYLHRLPGRRAAGRPVCPDEGRDHRLRRGCTVQRDRVPAGTGACRHDPHRRAGG